MKINKMEFLSFQKSDEKHKMKSLSFIPLPTPPPLPWRSDLPMAGAYFATASFCSPGALFIGKRTKPKAKNSTIKHVPA